MRPCEDSGQDAVAEVWVGNFILTPLCQRKSITWEKKIFLKGWSAGGCLGYQEREPELMETAT